MTSLRASLAAEPHTGQPSSDDLRHSQVARWYGEHHRHVYAVCLRILVDVDLAEDATQEAFVAAWKAWPQFRGESSEATWLHAIASRVALRCLRNGRRRAYDRSLDSDDVGPQARDVPLVDRIDLEAAIRALPPRARAVLVLHEIHGYRLTEIAGWMETSVGTVKSQLHRARNILMEKLDR